MEDGVIVMQNISLNQRQRIFVAIMFVTLSWVTYSVWAITDDSINPFDPLITASPQLENPEQHVQIAITHAGERVVSVGERGIVLFSDDKGMHWQQADVPVSVTLTAVNFINEMLGWVVGHGGVILHTNDGGKHWVKQTDGIQMQTQIAEMLTAVNETLSELEAIPLSPPDVSDPLLDISFLNTKLGYAVGSFGLILSTNDGGENWKPAFDHISTPKDNHYYAIEYKANNIYIAGERGTLLVSTDQGQTFQKLLTPYEGSYFGLSVMNENEIIVYGLRGNLYHSQDAGNNWEKVESDYNSSWVASRETLDNKFLLVNQTGTFVSLGQGENKLNVIKQTHFPTTDFIEITSDQVILSSAVGLNIINY